MDLRYKALLRDLRVNRNVNPAKVDAIRANAVAKLYHDFESPLAMPKTQLFHDLMRAGLIAMAEKSMKGDYDF